MHHRIIVTGGAGFIGSNLVQALNERGETDILVSDRLDHPEKEKNLERLRFSDYLDKAELRELVRKGRLRPPECLFHLGACSSTTETDEDYLYDNNFLYTRELCEWSLANGVRFIYASTAATYGDGSNGYSDDHSLIPSLRPLNPYGRSKQMFDEWALANGVLDKVAGIKYFNVYGPGEDHKGDMRSVVHKAYGQILREGKVSLFKSHRPEFEHGEQKRDFLYVEDAVKVTLFFRDNPSTAGIFNCGTGLARSWNDLAGAIFAALGLPVRIEYVDMPEHLRAKYQYWTQADISKLRRAGYENAFLSLEEGVRRYVQEYLSEKLGRP